MTVATPLAERMRPRSLEEFLGQEHLVGPKKILRRTVEEGRPFSFILWGPPGSGKTTLARIVAQASSAHFEYFSAVLSGVKELRQVIEIAQERRGQGQQTVLFVDEIHRFNKAQQDAFLPHVESGLLVLMGSTTQNPSFEIIGPLLSRTRVLTLNPLDRESLKKIIESAITDKERGLGNLDLHITDEALGLLAEAADGDARAALNGLELAAQAAASRQEAVGLIDRETVAQAIQQNLFRYDKNGEEHYNFISAFIKSMRGSDPDAAVYWLARMLEAGEDPLFIARRMIILASEDIGNADPHALLVAVAAKEAFHFVGLPEGFLPLAQAAIYLSCAPKSNAVLTAYVAAQKKVKELGSLPVPLHLRNAPTGLMKSLGYGRDYKYPHDYEEGYVREIYLPEPLAARRFYYPSSRGREKMLQEWLERLKGK
jgi:putative ATPase